MRIVPSLRSVAFLALFSFSTTVCQASASSTSSAVLASLKDIDYRYFVAGGTCAAISHGITTPIDVVKTRMQADPKVSILFLDHCVSTDRPIYIQL
jgi:hypothetical protein